jgi:protein gp37
MNRMRGGSYVKGVPRVRFKNSITNALAFNRRPWICDRCGTACKDSACPICTCLHDHTYHRRRIFTNSLSDWLDDEVPIEWLAEMLDTIRRCDQVTWILCTKRPENFKSRLESVLQWLDSKAPTDDEDDLYGFCYQWLTGERDAAGDEPPTPPSHVIILASVENQAMADNRVPELLKIPAAKRGLSLEPLLGPVDLCHIEADESLGQTYNCLTGYGTWNKDKQFPPLSWLIIGGESGPGARACNAEWVRSLVVQGKAAGVATFVKQIGAHTIIPHWIIKDKKGGDPSEWPEDLHVRQFPQ